MNSTNSLLQIHNLHASYSGGIKVLWGISLDANSGEIVTLIGSNGAGKSTLIKTITGLLKPTEGEIQFSGHSIKGLPSHEIVNLGIVQIPEGKKLFLYMTVKDNLELGSYPKRSREKKGQILEWVYTLFPRLRERENQRVVSMSGGEQQMAAIGRGLMNNPKMLLIDELSFGLAPLLVKEMFSAIKLINEQGVSVLLVEQNVKNALDISNRAFVIEMGRIVLQGKSQDILNNEDVKKAYLGL
jgi:branched-chain amino acid transport system ATP-binding protein